MTDYEPALAPDDTQPRRIDLGPFIDDPDERRGCGNPLLTALVGVIVFVLAIATVALGAFLGWRDGTTMRQTQRAVTVVANVDRQATLAWADLEAGRAELGRERCGYIVTLQPFYPRVRECMTTAQALLVITPSPTPAPHTATPTPTPTVEHTPTPGSTPNASGTGFSKEDLFARGQQAYQQSDFEETVSWLEALRGLDASFQRREVEDMLVASYQSLASQYQFEGQYSKMVIVIEKALKIRELNNANVNWRFTIEMAKLYMSAKGYLDAGNYGQAARVFNILMEKAPLFSTDTKPLACRAFSLAGDTTASSKYGC